ncbi:MAG: type III-A CRISPR-associated RAMP protein Csm5 [Syntrophorhabdales bacterium]|jgi:CRISPR-associated protein Csm5
MQTPLKFILQVLSPIHIGCDDVYEPTSFVIDEKKGALLEFDPMHLVQTLSSSQRTELLRLCADEDLLAIFKFVRRVFSPNIPRTETAVATGLVNHYKDVMNMSTYNKNAVINQFTMYKTAYNPQTNQPYVPGTSIKGALRTAYLSHLAGVKGIKDIKGGKGEARQLEASLLGGTFDSDPFRMVKVSDFQPFEKVKTRIIYGVNRKKRKSDRASRAESGPPQIFEVLEAGSTFEGAINIEQPEGTIAHPITKEVLFASANEHYGKIGRQDAQDMTEAGLKPLTLAAAPGDEAHSWLLIRIGRHSGAEAVTIEGNREIKILQGRDQSPLMLTRATTFWLASETSKPSTGDGLVPFGWAMLRAVPFEVEKGIYSLRERTSDVSPHLPVNEDAIETRDDHVTNITAPRAIEPILCEGVVVTWNPGSQTLMATVEGKKALSDRITDRSFVPESLWPKLEKKRSVKAAIRVLPRGNALKIVQVLDES